MKMKDKHWAALVDVATVVWIGFFIAGFVVKSAVAQGLCGKVMLCLLPVFVADLVILSRKEENFKIFIRKRWFDVLLVIPYFRIFRVLRFARLLKIMRLLRAKKALGATRFVKKSKRTVAAAARLRERDPNIRVDASSNRASAI